MARNRTSGLIARDRSAGFPAGLPAAATGAPAAQAGQVESAPGVDEPVTVPAPDFGT